MPGQGAHPNPIHLAHAPVGRAAQHAAAGAAADCQGAAPPECASLQVQGSSNMLRH